MNIKKIIQNLLIIFLSFTSFADAGAAEEGATNAISGTYQGHFICGLSMMSFALMMRVDDDGKIEASGQFTKFAYSLSNPLGVAVMSGKVRGNRMLSLKMDDWVKRPGGMEPLEFYGFIDAKKGEIIGKVCDGNFSLQRLKEERNRGYQTDSIGLPIINPISGRSHTFRDLKAVFCDPDETYVVREFKDEPPNVRLLFSTRAGRAAAQSMLVPSSAIQKFNIEPNKTAFCQASTASE